MHQHLSRLERSEAVTSPKAFSCRSLSIPTTPFFFGVVAETMALVLSALCPTSLPYLDSDCKKQSCQGIGQRNLRLPSRWRVVSLFVGNSYTADRILVRKDRGRASLFTGFPRRVLLGNSDAYSVSSRKFVEDRSLHRIHPWLFHPWLFHPWLFHPWLFHPWLFHPWLRFRPWVDLGLHPTPQCQP